MSKVSITRSLLDDLAMSISAKSGEAVPLTLTEMKDAVDSIQTGGSGFVTQDQDGFLVIPHDGSGGGGGSSDFSTAQVTFNTNLSEQYAQIFGAIIDISSQLDYPTSVTTIATADVEITNGDVYTVVLYNGNAYVNIQAVNITVSGNATAEEYDSEYGIWLITITGDCTITIS